MSLRPFVLDVKSLCAGVCAILMLSGTAQAANPDAPNTLLKPHTKGAEAASASIAAPQGVVAAASNGGVQLYWKSVGEAATYLVLRGTTAAPTEPAIARVAAGTLGWIDKGFNAAASYQIVAVAADGRRGASALVAYQPAPAKAALLGSRAVAQPAPSAPSAPLAPALNAAAMPKAAAQEIRPTRAGTLLDPGAATNTLPPPPSITSVRLLNMVSSSFLARVGDTIVVRGSGFAGLSSVKLSYAKQVNGVWQPNPDASRSYTAPTADVTAGELKFVIPAVALGLNNDATLVVTLARGAASSTGTDVILVGPTPTARKIVSVEQDVVRAGGRIRINGMGFNDVPGPGGYNGVIGGYFGVGTPGSVSNPLVSVANRAATYAELWLPRTCNQEGVLMLVAPRAGGGSDDLIIATPSITVACLQTEPSGRVVVSEAAPNATITVAPGAPVTIRGTGLRHVTRVVNQALQAFAFTYQSIGSGNTVIEQLHVTMPQTAGAWVQFFLENKLTDPVLPGTVAGYAMTASA